MNDEIFHDETDNAICPYCGHEDKDSWEICCGDEGDFETECGSCGLIFMCRRNVSISYSTRRIDAALAGEGENNDGNA